MQVLVRADASLDLGTGHIMRCLTLVEALEAKALFVCTRRGGHLGGLVAARGHRVHLLEAGLSQAQDAAQTAALIGDARLVIVDHYMLDATWEGAMPAPVIVIDDLANRNHDCAVLLDQNLGRTDLDYDGLVPADCVRLTGPQYALLRPEFLAARADALTRRKAETGPVRNVLIVMGGTDAPNATGWVIAQLARMDLPADMTVTAVLGVTAPHLDAVRDALATLPCNGELLVGTDRMADLMSQSDLAIGAAGSTSWERCAVGLPTVIVVLADNQFEGAVALAASGAAQLVTLHDTANLAEVLDEVLHSSHSRRTMSDAAAGIADGRGSARVAEMITSCI
ncbi:MAG: UDP-2,4-diacetamido-2,4,6-trideoxy-beta-L-altropyranose hydrolase [Alteromonadaceae bacterium]|nr:UDP-2,4-diacetamido-2,4,6-trideoxy-beta-L-altropyranose hydrolase [Alteromonadaceae bacterium]|tara:strand:+ start:578 stop:1594 length:1017 start_codon:yes stop_codon:yes gene_type:complete